jgi:uncharacterized protein YqfA (UPF0365 family)
MGFLLGVLVLLVFFAVAAIALIHYSMYQAPWSKCRKAGAKLPIWTVALMDLRRVDFVAMCDCVMAMHQAGEPYDVRKMEAQLLAGGNIRKVVAALLMCRQHNISGASYKLFAMLDLLGYDPVADCVQKSKPNGPLHVPVVVPFRQDAAPVHAATH